MKRISRSFLALSISLAVVLASVACKKGGKTEDQAKTAARDAVRSAVASGQVIQESDPFYELEEFQLEIPLEKDRILVGRWINSMHISQNRIFAFFDDSYAIDDETAEKWKQHILGKKKLSDEEAERIEKIVLEKDVSMLAVFDLHGNLVTTRKAGTQFEPSCVFEGPNGQTMVLYTEDSVAKISELSDSLELSNTLTLSDPKELVNMLSFEEEIQYVSNCMYTPNGNLILDGAGFTCQIGSDGIVTSFSWSHDRGGQYKIDGKFYRLTESMSTGSSLKYEFSEIDLDTGKNLEGKYEWPFEYGEQEKIIRGKNDIYMNTTTGLSRIDLQSGEYTVVIPWNQTDCYRGEILSDSLRIVSDDECYFAVEMKFDEDQSTKAESFQEVFRFYVQHLKKTAKNPHAGKRYLSAMGINTDNDALYNSIVDYNRDTTKKSRIFLTDFSNSWLTTFANKYKGSVSAIEDQVYIDLVNGQGPDILINFGSSLQYERDNVLLDLNTLIDKDKDIDRTKYFDNIFHAAEKNGKLYRLPLMFYLSGMEYNTQFLGERDSITWQDINSVIASLPQDVQILPETERTLLLSSFLTGSITRFVDYEKQEVHFDTDEFRQMMEFVKTYAVNKDQMPTMYMDDADAPVSQMLPEAKMKRGLVAMMVTSVGSGENYVSHLSMGQDHLRLCGYPESGEGMLMDTLVSVSISKCCAYPEEAWSFVKSLLDEKTQRNMPPKYTGGIPVNREALNKNIEKEIADFESSKSLGVTGTAGLEMDRIKDFPAFVEKVQTGMKYDTNIMGIVVEEANAYFNGQQSLDKVIRNIEKRAKLVVQERA